MSTIVTFCPSNKKDSPVPYSPDGTVIFPDDSSYVTPTVVELLRVNVTDWDDPASELNGIEIDELSDGIVTVPPLFTMVVLRVLPAIVSSTLSPVANRSFINSNTKSRLVVDNVERSNPPDPSEKSFVS